MGGTTICLKRDSMEKLLKDMREDIMACAETWNMSPTSDLVVKDETGKEYVFEALVTVKEGWVKPLVDLNNPFYRYFFIEQLFQKVDTDYYFLCMHKGIEPTDFPIASKWLRRYARDLLKKLPSADADQFFVMQTKFQQEQNKGRYDVLIYPKSFKNAKRMLSNLAVEEVVANYFKEDIQNHKFEATIHLHT